VAGDLVASSERSNSRAPVDPRMSANILPPAVTISPSEDMMRMSTVVRAKKNNVCPVAEAARPGHSQIIAISSKISAGTDLDP